MRLRPPTSGGTGLNQIESQGAAAAQRARPQIFSSKREGVIGRKHGRQLVWEHLKVSKLYAFRIGPDFTCLDGGETA